VTFTPSVPDAEITTADEREFTEYLLNETDTQGRGRPSSFDTSDDETNWSELKAAFLTELPA
jgi:hypothetical protein